jgi:hypothetical protein
MPEARPPEAEAMAVVLLDSLCSGLRMVIQCPKQLGCHEYSLAS